VHVSQTDSLALLSTTVWKLLSVTNKHNSSMQSLLAGQTHITYILIETCHRTIKLFPTSTFLDYLSSYLQEVYGIDDNRMKLATDHSYSNSNMTMTGSQ